MMQYRYWDKHDAATLVRSTVGSAYDVELNDMGLLSELVQQRCPPRRLRHALPRPLESKRHRGTARCMR
jgi:hypothetical protein